MLHKCWFIWECLKRKSSKVKQTVYIHVPLCTSCWLYIYIYIFLFPVLICSYVDWGGNVKEPLWLIQGLLSAVLSRNGLETPDENDSFKVTVFKLNRSLDKINKLYVCDSYTSHTGFHAGYHLIIKQLTFTHQWRSIGNNLLENTLTHGSNHFFPFNGKSLDNSHWPNIKKWEKRWVFSSNYKYSTRLI